MESPHTHTHIYLSIHQVPDGRAHPLAANPFWIPARIFLLPRPPFQPLGFPCLPPPRHCHQLDRLVDCSDLSCPSCGISYFLLLSVQFQSGAKHYSIQILLCSLKPTYKSSTTNASTLVINSTRWQLRLLPLHAVCLLFTNIWFKPSLCTLIIN